MEPFMVVKALWRIAYVLSRVPGQLKRFLTDICGWPQWAYRSFRDATWRQCLAYFWERAPWAVAAVVIYYFISPELANSYRFSESISVHMPDTLSLQQVAERIYTWHFAVLAALYCGTTAMKQERLLGQIFWWYMFVAELSAVVEYMICKMIGDGLTQAALEKLTMLQGVTSSCGRLLGVWGEYGVLTFNTVIMTYLVVRAFQVWRNTILNKSGG